MSKYFICFLDDLINRLTTLNYGQKFTFILILLCMARTESLLKEGKEYTYAYEVISNTGVLLPSKASSSWGIEGILTIKAKEDLVLMQVKQLLQKRKKFYKNNNFCIYV